MPLLNYTTTVPAMRTVGQITELLAHSGAVQVLNEYDRGNVTGIAFAIDVPGLGLMRYRLPVDVAAVEKVLRGDRAVPPRLKTAVQAERVAWRILKDWIEAQLAIVATRMVTLDQVMLPYMMMNNATVYDLWRGRQLQLGAGDG